MPKQPFFSVIIPTYNYASLLPSAIESVLAQSFNDFELLIQDDMSTDDTDAVIGHYDDPRISYCKNTSNLGIFGNLNQLCARSKGRYIKVLCADDMLSEWCLESIIGILRKENFQYKVVSVKESPDPMQIVHKPLLDLLKTHIVNRNTLFSYLAEPDNWGAGLAELCVERDFFESLGFFGETDKSSDFSKDILTWLEMVLKTDALMIADSLVFQRSHPNQARYKLARITQLREMLDFFYGRESDLYLCPDFIMGRQFYLDRYVLSHYVYGVKATFQGHGAAYFREVRNLLEQAGYRGFPWYLLISKMQQRLLSHF
ncbi:glycosyltransferase family 2 protein [Methylovulum psychrotolerans]|uniref:Glycosyltransferase 2-like domain-containing protein n=1 Tax=Methylovulum psychrotolerans TaxID=1704499 RepID=A0A1Z4BWN6_9GAMM|nr:glycosyltransferase family 2 protein [Methylovulum psychrotolerans]ASF45698.1 hypothetical protein CEK71_06210 [Methylovulum psychrotolerans]